MVRLVPASLLLPLLLLGAGWLETGVAGEGTFDPVVTGNAAKICFDLNRLDGRGLQGPPDGLRALHYEYCIPDRPEALQAVAAIDPTLEIQRGSPGHIGCGTQGNVGNVDGTCLSLSDPPICLLAGRTLNHENGSCVRILFDRLPDT